MTGARLARVLCIVGMSLAVAGCSPAQPAGGPLPAGTGWVDYHGYTKCAKLHNDHCTVVLCHQCGGRVLEYAWKGRNVMALNDKQAGKVYDPKTRSGGAADGGRFDIGPENTIPPMTLLLPRSAENSDSPESPPMKLTTYHAQNTRKLPFRWPCPVTTKAVSSGGP